MTISANHLTGA